jgi:hypothetical protein
VVLSPQMMREKKKSERQKIIIIKIKVKIKIFRHLLSIGSSQKKFGP